MPEYTPGYMCDWCKASAATIDTIDHERDCPRPRILQMMEELASLHAENARLHNENEKLRASLKIIHTWAEMDIQRPAVPHLLNPDAVLRQCRGGLGITDQEEHNA